MRVAGFTCGELDRAPTLVSVAHTGMAVFLLEGLMVTWVNPPHLTWLCRACNMISRQLERLNRKSYAMHGG